MTTSSASSQLSEFLFMLREAEEKLAATEKKRAEIISNGTAANNHLKTAKNRMTSEHNRWQNANDIIVAHTKNRTVPVVYGSTAHKICNQQKLIMDQSAAKVPALKAAVAKCEQEVEKWRLELSAIDTESSRLDGEIDRLKKLIEPAQKAQSE